MSTTLCNQFCHGSPWLGRSDLSGIAAVAAGWRAGTHRACVRRPHIGWVLDRYWAGAVANGVRLYGATAWQAGFTLMFGTACLSLVALLFARESYCRQTP
jgi:hypothetical protein